MKICSIIYTYTPYQVGGGDIHVSKISHALAESSHKEVIISINPTRKDIIEENGNINYQKAFDYRRNLRKAHPHLGGIAESRLKTFPRIIPVIKAHSSTLNYSN